MRVRALRPADEPFEARRRIALVGEAVATLEQGEPLPRIGLDPLDDVLARIERGADVRASELVVIARVLAAGRALGGFLMARSSQLPRLTHEWHAEALQARELERIERAVVAAIEPDGRVKDEASEELRRSRHAVAAARKGLGDKVRQLSGELADVIREGGPVERDGRIGLPIRADAHRRVEGIVLDTSATGATLYVEPPELTRMGNRLRIAEAEVGREERRIVSELASLVRAQVAAARTCCDGVVAADELGAVAAWARDAGATVVVVDDEPLIDLVRARHPLLVEHGGEVVPNDVVVAAGRALIVSGPNAGGKTVALKTAGLAALMVRAGLPVCADPGSRVGWFDPVVTDVGDQQSIDRSLSTFSAHVVNYREMLRAAAAARGDTGRALVLLDEVAGSTDPEEGAALAVSLLEAFLDVDAAVIATTHHERLKQQALDDARFSNAAVGFDLDAMRPTFSLRMGVIGASAALAAAARHGLPASVVERARGLLPEAVVQREQLLAALERERKRERSAREAAEADQVRVRQLRAELEEERKHVRERERSRLQNEASALTDAIRAARHRLRDLDRSQREGSVVARDAERVVDEAARVVAVGSAVEAATRMAEVGGGAVEPEAVRPGATFTTARLGIVEVLEAPDRGSVRVRAGAFNLRVPVEELRVAPRKKGPAAPRRIEVPDVRRTLAPSVDRVIRTEGLTCDLRGLRADEALAELDRFIDRCLRHSDGYGFALHGHGTGALRLAVREHLALHGSVSRSRPAEVEEGGDAFTVFWLS